ncbi:MAG: DUF5697 family protein, partial [Ruthenibacterium sp.]
MSTIHNNTIKEILKKYKAMPDPLLRDYLRLKFNMTENLAGQTIFDACRKNYCVAKDGYVALYDDIEIDSSIIAKCRAFRVSLEFYPESMDSMFPSAPWLLAFVANNKNVYICQISKGQELTIPSLIISRTASKDEREYTQRIAILGKGCDKSLIDHCGITSYCVVDDAFN